MIKKTQPFKTVTKDRLFYDKFEYCVSFHLDEVSCLRDLSHNNIDELIKRRKLWREIAQQRWPTGKQGHSILGRRSRPITDQTVTQLHDVAQLLLSSQHEFKLVVSVDQAWVYTNAIELITQLDQVDFLRWKCYTQVSVDRPKDTVKLKKSLYQYRTYLCMIKMTPEQVLSLVKFLQNQNGQVRLSPALNQWVDDPGLRIQDYYFLDHHDISWLTMLSLVRPGLVRKTMHIITDK